MGPSIASASRAVKWTITPSSEYSDQCVSTENRLATRSVASRTYLPVNPFSLAAGNQTALFIDQLFPGSVPDGFQGSLEVTTSEEGVVVMGLLMTQGILTSLPTHHFGGWQQGNGMMP